MKTQITRPHALLRISTLSTVLLMILVLLGPNSLDAQNDRSTLKNFQHVFVIMMENTGYATLIGNANAPFTNFAASNYGLEFQPAQRDLLFQYLTYWPPAVGNAGKCASPLFPRAWNAELGYRASERYPDCGVSHAAIPARSVQHFQSCAVFWPRFGRRQHFRP